MNISKSEQRVLHALAQGGCIRCSRTDGGKLARVECVTREGFTLSACTRDLVVRLRKRRFIRSIQGKPYQITRDGLHAVRAQLDNK